MYNKCFEQINTMIPCANDTKHYLKMKKEQNQLQIKFLLQGTLVGIRYLKRHIHTNGLQTFKISTTVATRSGLLMFSVSRHVETNECDNIK